MPLGVETWFVNFTQIDRLFQTPVDLANIQSPRVEYAIYWTLKSAQVASVVGGLMVHPAYRYYLLRQLKRNPEKITPNSRKIIRNLCRRVQGRFLLASFVAGPLTSVALTNLNDWSDKELAEKCYKIRCDTPGLILDRSTAIMAFIGWYWKRFQGAVDGVNLSLAYAALYLTVLEKNTNPILLDKIKPSQRFATSEEGLNNRSELMKYLSTNKEFSS